MEDLKPCPFCGGEAKVKAYSNGYNIWFRVMCDDCGVAQDGIRNGYYGEENAVEAWNKRTETHGEEKPMEKLKPCPFCGGEGEFRRSNSLICFIQCKKCAARTDEVRIDFDYSARERATEMWNRRVNDAEIH